MKWLYLHSCIIIILLLLLLSPIVSDAVITNSDTGSWPSQTADISKPIIGALGNLLEYIDDTHGGRRELVRTGMKCGINATSNTLTAVEQVTKALCREHPSLVRHVSKIAIKSSAREAVELAARTRMAREGTNVVAVQGMNGLAENAISRVGIAADFAQIVLEATGYEKAGKAVGVGGNIAAGALTGFSVGGLAGAVNGSLSGLVVWGMGEVAGGLVERAIDYS